jgi:two-component system cell cycle sensor histidine kinase/response regulator CckA
MVERSDGDETILLVEDDEPLRESAARMLRAHGFTVLTAPDGVAALATFHGHPGRVHLVIADLVMPRMHGPQLYQALHAGAETVKFLYISGYGGDDTRRLFGDDIAYLPKPWTMDELVTAVRETLDG